MSADKDRSFTGTFTLVLGGLGAVTIAIIVIATVLSAGVERHPRLEQARLQQRLKPVAVVVTSASALAKPSSASAAAAGQGPTGEQVVSQVCSACHVAGVLGAPKIGDHTEWSRRFTTQGGLKGLLGWALKGKGNMPPKGGNPALTEDEIESAIKYMLSKSGVQT